MSYARNKFFNVFGSRVDKRAQQITGTSNCYTRTCVLKDGSGTVSGTVCPNVDGITYTITITKMYADGTTTTQTYTVDPQYFNGTGNPYSQEETLNYVLSKYCK